MSRMYVLRAWVRRDDPGIELDDDEDENPYISDEMLRNLLERANLICGEAVTLPDNDRKSGILATRLCNPGNPEPIKFNALHIRSEESCCSGWDRFQRVEGFDKEKLDKSEEYVEEEVIVVTDALDESKGAHIYETSYIRRELPE